MREAAKQLTDFAVPFETKVLSAHRTPDALEAWVKRLAAAGARCFIAGAGVLRIWRVLSRRRRPRPCSGCPCPRSICMGSIRCCPRWQMPKGIPVATFAIGRPAPRTRACSRSRCSRQSDAKLAKRLAQFRAAQAEAVKSAKLPV